jgi:hypothetical protein
MHEASYEQSLAKGCVDTRLHTDREVCTKEVKLAAVFSKVALTIYEELSSITLVIRYDHFWSVTGSL